MPNRIIKDSIRTSKSVNALSDFQFRLWLYLITYVDDYGRGSADAEILKGFVFPRRKSVTEAQIQRGLDDLATTGMIRLYEADGEPYFCFPNWDKHQRIQTKRSKYPDPEESTVIHRESPPESESKSEYKSESESKQEPREDAFDVFWNAYPKKVGKEAARKAFARVKVPVETLTAAVQRQKGSDQWSRDNGQYIPNPATWLNQGRWEDELAPAGKPQQQKKKFDGASWGNETPEERQKALDNARRVAKMLGAEVKP